MTNLDTIFARKHEQLAAQMTHIPLEELRRRADDAPPTRGFRQALANGPSPVSLIAEVKKASPSAGTIREDFDPAAIALAYRAAGAQCLSVLTDVEFFQGAPENLRICREVSGLPVLRKDFTAAPYHVYEARALGADAILLIAAKLSDPEIHEMQAIAWELGMDALVEVHDEGEADRAVALGANLIGINNRDLSTFEVDLSTTERLANRISNNALLVAESALHSAEDVDRVAKAGARAVLIGTAFCSSPDVEGRVREVMRW